MYTIGFNNSPLTLKFQASISILMNRRFVDYRSSFSSIGIAWRIRPKKKPEQKKEEEE